MADGIDEEDFKKLAYEVHPNAESEIRRLLTSLDEDWSPFIPSVLQSDSYFTRSGYRVGNTLVPDMLEVVIRVHKTIIGDALGMLTINSYERNGVIHINCSYTTGIPDGFKRWREIGGERKGDPIVIESRTVEYPEPTEGDSHSDEEVEEIVQDVVDVIQSLAVSYENTTEKDVIEYYQD